MNQSPATDQVTESGVPVAASFPSSGPSFSGSWLGRAFAYLTGSPLGRYQAVFVLLVVFALLLRLWELSERTMHYDEAIHLYYSWRLSNLEGFIHSPWMHGPFQIDLVAAFLRLFGDTDFAARMAYALFGAILVGLPYFLREWLGKSGALLTGLLLAMSPSLLYFSRFGRNDILMAVFAVSLFALLWHYAHNPRRRYLFLGSAVLALAFSAKESAYILAAIFGLLALLLALADTSIRPRISFRKGARNLVAAEPVLADGDTPEGDSPPTELEGGRGWLARWREWLTLKSLNPAAGFLALLVTLTLPLWSAGIELVREIAASLASRLNWVSAAASLDEGFGLTLVDRDAATQGIVGAPVWEAPFISLPLTQLGVWPPGVAVLVLVTVGIYVAWRVTPSWRGKAASVCIPVAIAWATALVLVRPIGSVVDLFLALLLAVFCAAAFKYLMIPWRNTFLLVFAPLALTMTYLLLFLPVLKVDALLLQVLPDGVQVDSSSNAVPLNIIVAAGILLLMTLVSLAAGIRWNGGVWLTCAAIFWGIWATLYTTFFTNLAGLFSGAWQGMGYWIAQQEVARGNQPWYYYFVGLSVYEFLPLVLGVIGAIHFVRKRDRFGMALAFWAGVNLLAYTIASEKMPWLLVNITVPFILLAGKALGELVDRVQWRRVFSRDMASTAILCLVAPGLFVALGLYSAMRFTESEGDLPYAAFTTLIMCLLLALTGAWAVRQSGRLNGPALAGLGVAGSLAILTTWTAIQAAYTYDDSRREILVYAQGSANLRDSFAELDEQFFADASSQLVARPVQIDYDTWYPIQWDLRHLEREGYAKFSCFRDEGGQDGCLAPAAGSPGSALLVASHHRPAGSLTGFDEFGPRRNLLWYPETYRRPGEDRQSEEIIDEIRADLVYFGEAGTSKDKWHQALKYFLTRDMESDWFNSEYYTYLRQESENSEHGQ
ncbi:MAG: TIGR03663 family protein [Chloroflexi bacterium]|nr:TIGR03663 family protein [Chloroflexota bacterium]